MESQELINIYTEIAAANTAARGLVGYARPGIESVQRFNSLVDLAAEQTGNHGLTSYKVTLSPIGKSGRYSVNSDEYKHAVYTVARILHETHLPNSTIPPDEPSASQGASGGTSIAPHFHQAQTSQQSTQVHVELNQTIIALTELLTKKEADYEENTPERSFISKLKSALATATSSVEVFKLVLVIAGEAGLNIDQLKHIFL